MTQLDDDTLLTLATRMLSDYDQATPGTVFGEGLRLELPDAWRLQSAVSALREDRGESVVGYKIGCVRENNQRSMGLTHPAWGRLWSTEQHPSGAVLSKEKYANPAMEAEFGITLSRSVELGKTSPKDLVPAIEAIYPVIEIHNLAFRGEAPLGHELLANNAIHAGVVRGDPVSDITEPRTTDLKLIYDGETVDEWEALAWPHDMLEAIGWLSEQLALMGKRLEKGDLILTGAWGPPIPMGERSRVDVTSSAFGNVSATFS